MSPRLLALAVAAVAIALPAGCGEDPEGDVRDALQGYTQAIAQKDYQRLCDDLFAASLVRQVETRLPCEVALQRSDLDQAREPRIEVRSVEIDGESATAKVRATAANQKPSEDTVRLVKEDGEWRIVALAS